MCPTKQQRKCDYSHPHLCRSEANIFSVPIREQNSATAVFSFNNKSGVDLKNIRIVLVPNGARGNVVVEALC
jgi:hypothetical protein